MQFDLHMYLKWIFLLSGIWMVYWLLRNTFCKKKISMFSTVRPKGMVGRWVLVSRPSRPKMSAKEYAFVKCDVTRDCSYIEICLSSKPTGLHDSAQMKFSQILHALKTWPTITKGWRKSWNWNTIVPDSSPFVSISSMFVFKGLIQSKSCFLFLTQ